MKCSAPEHWSKMHVVRLGSDPGELLPVPGGKAGRDVPEIICVGRLVPAKGQLVLLQAARILLSAGERFHATLVGDGPDRAHLEAFIRDNNLAGHVTLLGSLNHDRALEQVRSADIFVLASFAEGIPIALMEAMALQVPCISTGVAGIPELISNGKDGVLVPPSSVDQLASALKKLLRNPDSRRRLGEAGRKRVIESYNLPKNLDLLTEKLNELLALA
jgi:colanic acid/amylovoran biosynthesis glycosyltransferase